MRLIVRRTRVQQVRGAAADAPAVLTIGRRRYYRQATWCGRPVYCPPSILVHVETADWMISGRKITKGTRLPVWPRLLWRQCRCLLAAVAETGGPGIVSVEILLADSRLRAMRRRLTGPLPEAPWMFHVK